MPEESQLQVARILAMASWINDNPGHTVRQIAQHFGRTSRQVRRDIEYMGEIGDSMLDRSYGIDWQLYDEQEILVMRGSTLPSLPSFTDVYKRQSESTAEERRLLSSERRRGEPRFWGRTELCVCDGCPRLPCHRRRRDESRRRPHPS